MVFRRRALVRGAMVGGAAYYAGRSGAQNQAREAEQQQRIEMLEAEQAMRSAPPVQMPPPAQQAQQPSIVEQLTQLKSLLDAGVLTQNEFEAQKAKILASS